MLTDIKGEIDNNATIVGDFNTPLTSVDRSSRQKINKEMEALNETLDQLDLIDICRTLQKKNRRTDIIFKCTWNILQNRSHARPQEDSSYSKHFFQPR